MMRAITIRGGKGGVDALEVQSVPRPELRSGQVLVRVRAAGINRPDLLQRAGRYPPPPGASEILGLEVAGEIAGVGAGVERWREGDRVTALLPGGGYAEYALVDARHALHIHGNDQIVGNVYGDGDIGPDLTPGQQDRFLDYVRQGGLSG